MRGPSNLAISELHGSHVNSWGFTSRLVRQTQWYPLRAIVYVLPTTLFRAVESSYQKSLILILFNNEAMHSAAAFWCLAEGTNRRFSSGQTVHDRNGR